MKLDLEYRRFASVSALLLAVAALSPGLPSVAAAGVQDRQDRQRERIVRGVEDGSLTKGETARLIREQARIEGYERRSRRDDGVLGPRERARLDFLQDRAGARIRRERTDTQTR